MKEKEDGSGLTVYVFNVGQGDHVLLEFPNGEYGIIDFYYETNPPLNLLEPPALTFLRHRRASNPDEPIVLSFICLTHPDMDHTKGVDDLLDWVDDCRIKVRELWLFAGREFAEIVSHYRRAYHSCKKIDKALKKRIESVSYRFERVQAFRKSFRGAQQFVQGVARMSTIGDDINVVAIAPLTSDIHQSDDRAWTKFCRLVLEGKRPSSSDNNLMSSVLLVTFQQHKLLFGGDTSHRIWQSCLDYYDTTRQREAHGLCKGDFIKTSHHGSRYSSSPQLWGRILGPDSQVVVSAGRGRYKHPHSETIKHILQAARETESTPEVLSTNMCSRCLNDGGVAKENVDWFSTTKRRTKPEVETMLTVSRSRKAREGDRRPEFAAFIYRFVPDGADVSVTKAVTKSRIGRSNCLYRKHPKGKFPWCVYR
jgi:beta-lactamase superfamily II metal-dependent hydrolase